jgi:hypothetical protein
MACSNLVYMYIHFVCLFEKKRKKAKPIFPYFFLYDDYKEFYLTISLSVWTYSDKWVNIYLKENDYQTVTSRPLHYKANALSHKQLLLILGLDKNPIQINSS